jgi:hypothetical protein
LHEHSNQNTKRLHFIGTGIFIALVVAQPPLAVSALAAGAVGYTLFPLCRHMQSGAFEFAAMFVVYMLTARLSLRSWWRIVLPIVVAYSFAWVAHFFVEHNRPATFIYPSFSLFGMPWCPPSKSISSMYGAGDFRMLYEAVTGKLPL